MTDANPEQVPAALKIQITQFIAADQALIAKQEAELAALATQQALPRKKHHRS